MGQEIAKQHFQEQDWQTFAARLHAETALLQQLFKDNALSTRSGIGGFELEAWLTDKAFRPACCNAQFLRSFNHPLATTELAQFNIELNTDPMPLKAKVFSRFQENLCTLLQQAQAHAAQMDKELLFTGILPTATQDDFSLEAMSASHRYQALNAEFIKARQYQAVTLAIQGENYLEALHDSLMLEAAATSFQIHFQVDVHNAHHYYNAAQIVSAPIVALAANSPFLFGQSLWHETRIPLFEQALDSGSHLPQRVIFGSGFAKQSIMECFTENETVYPILLPVLFDKTVAYFAHLRFHNGVIWRWNRPLLGFDEDGTPHIRLEHRILPAGPSVPDMLANAAFFYGLVQAIGDELAEGKLLPLDFETARQGFYQAAQKGLTANLQWHKQSYTAKALIQEHLLEKAIAGLRQLGIDESDIQAYLGIIAARTDSGQTGAVWQQCHFKQQASFQQLLHDYVRLQRTHTPVHTWTLA
ncbi:MAG: glutamate--cysteine ligase [Proteobacteria bacterium]|nr:MAG: glutamate--cysteine ligase [Pseudomonadota bacterium]